MGKSSGACFKIIPCGRASLDHEDLEAPESKISNDRRGWSFRKRSAGHRVLNNSVISEAASSLKKESPESTHINAQTQSDLTVPEKNWGIQWKEEKIELSAQRNSKLMDTISAKEDDSRDDEDLDESSITVIQAAIRGFLAHRVLLKRKNVIKMQAAVRGHLVRQRAMGTLRCIQAIVKIQALVRARRGRPPLEGSGDSENQNQSSEKCNPVPTVLRSKSEAKSDDTFTYISIEKLLSNRFARQLMESSPRSKTINIKCDTSKSDDSWKWLERWMSVSSVGNDEEQESGSAAEQHEKESLGHFDRKGDISVPSDFSPDPSNIESGAEQHEKENLGYSDCKRGILVPSYSSPEPTNFKSGAEQHEEQNLGHADSIGDILVPSGSSPDPTNFKSGEEQHEKQNLGCADGKGDILVPSDCFSGPTNFEFCVGASTEEFVNDDNLISCDRDTLDLQSSKLNSSSFSPPELQNIDKSDLTGDATESSPSEMKEADSNLKLEAKNLPGKDETVNECGKHDVQKFSSELPETEAKKFSRKASNPAFIAAQLKFEELSSAPVAAKVDTSSSQGPEVECSLDMVSLASDQPFRSLDIGLSQNSISDTSAVQIGGSECGTEISISSALDSPGRSEVGVNEIEQEPKNSNAMVDCSSKENSGLETHGTSCILGTDLSHANTNLLERDENINSATGECDNSVVTLNSLQLEKNPEADANSQQLEQGSEASNLVHKSSPDASPRSHITITESQTTPSYQESIKPKKSRGEKSESSHKNRSSLSGKNSRSNPSQDSTPRTSLEQLPKDHKAGKRRNSLGSSKTDNPDQEPKDSSISNSLPSYMQATESARAKAIASVSPRSSPDVQEKDIYIKKRHSLPVTNGRQGSPHIQRSLSQAQQNAKGNNGTHSPQERKWRR